LISKKFFSSETALPNEMSNLYRGPSIDASYQVSVHFVKGFQRKIFVKNADRLKKGILEETKRAHQLKGRCIFIDLDMGFPKQVAYIVIL
jgi:hypothetical protein